MQAYKSVHRPVVHYRSQIEISGSHGGEYEDSIVIFSVLANNLNNTTTIKWDMCITL
jgi:hypothetical protein